MLISMIGLSVLFRVKAEDAATAASSTSEQAWAAAMAGVEEAIHLAARKLDDPVLWQDNPQLLRDRFVCDDGAERWYFTVWSAAEAVDSREPIRYGLTDESSKLNVNIATETNLMRLPNMTASLAQSLLDFIDTDSAALPEGAEQDSYDLLPKPYTIRNGWLASLGELMLVRGFSAPLLYGEDANMNLILDPNEDDGEQTYPPDSSDGRLDPGLASFLTVSSYEFNEDDQAVPRTDVNDPQDPLPQVELPSALTNYLFLMRSNKVSVSHVAELLEAKTKFKDASGKEQEWDSGVGKEELPLVLDLFTANYVDWEDGLLNVNTASAKVLATLPDIDDSLAEAIVSARRAVALEKRKTIAWLYTEDLVDAALFKKIAPHLTARAFQYSFHVVGYSLPSGRYRVLEVTIDVADYKPAIIYLRDLTRLGMPFRVETNPEEAPRG